MRAIFVGPCHYDVTRSRVADGDDLQNMERNR